MMKKVEPLSHANYLFYKIYKEKNKALSLVFLLAVCKFFQIFLAFSSYKEED